MAAPMKMTPAAIEPRMSSRLDPKRRPVTAETIARSPKRPVTSRHGAAAMFQSAGETPIPFSPRSAYTGAASMVKATTISKVTGPTVRRSRLLIAPNPIQVRLDQSECESDADGPFEREHESGTTDESSVTRQLGREHQPDQAGARTRRVERETLYVLQPSGHPDKADEWRQHEQPADRDSQDRTYGFDSASRRSPRADPKSRISRFTV
jgi:hypothetical protein